MAKLVESKTTRDFVDELPLTVKLDDLVGSEKYSTLTNELSKDGLISTTLK